jgi:hypothetical protein
LEEARRGGRECRRQLPRAAPLSGRFACRNIGLPPLDVMQRESAHQTRTEQRLNVDFDAAPTNMKCRCFYRSSVATKDATGLSFLKKPIADLADRQACSG